MDSDLGLFFAAVFLFICAVIGNLIFRAKLNASAKFVTKRAEFIDMAGGVAILHKRDPQIAKYIKIEDSKSVTVAYEPEKLHVGAVSVGGVTTGGTYTTGGYHYISGVEKTGKYRLVYVEDGRKYEIREVKLDDRMYEQAKESYVSFFLDEKEHKLSLSNNVVLSSFEEKLVLEEMSRYGNSKTLLSKAGLTYEQCQKIIHWLCGNN